MDASRPDARTQRLLDDGRPLVEFDTVLIRSATLLDAASRAVDAKDPAASIQALEGVLVIADQLGERIGPGCRFDVDREQLAVARQQVERLIETLTVIEALPELLAGLDTPNEDRT